MVSSISFKSTPTLQNGTIQGAAAPALAPQHQPAKQEGDGFIRSSFKSVAYLKKAYNVVKETAVGAVCATLAGITAGGSVMGLDWIIQRASGRGIKDQSAILTPLKTVGNIIGGACKKFAKAFSKDTSMGKILAYPFVGFPKDIYRYVKTAQGGSKAGKAVAVAIGLGAAAFSVCKTIVRINRLNADVDHGFKVGHNS